MERPLQALVIDETAIAEDELASILGPYLRFTSSGDVVLEDRFNDLSAREQVLCLLLGARAAHLLGLRDRAGSTPGELASAGGMSGGTVRPKLSELLRERLIAKEGRDYVIPVPALRRVGRQIAERER